MGKGIKVQIHSRIDEKRNYIYTYIMQNNNIDRTCYFRKRRKYYEQKD